MKTRLLRWFVLACAATLAACSSTPVAPPEDLPPTLVTRTSDATVWTTAEAEAAARAAALAPRPSASRTVPGSSLARPGAAPASATARPGAAPAAAGPLAAAPPGLPAPGADAGPPTRLIYFDFDRYEIKPEFNAALEGHARLLAANRALRLVIEGHADERGGAEYNLALGQKRAHAVVQALRLLGVTDAQAEPVSFGDTRPVARGQTEEAWAQNRRAEIKDR